jgi:hypothetical protein
VYGGGSISDGKCTAMGIFCDYDHGNGERKQVKEASAFLIAEWQVERNN